MFSKFTVTCTRCNYTASTLQLEKTIDQFIDILEPEEITCGVYAWARCPKCQYEEEIV